MKRLRGAIIGTGMISEYHIKAWNRIEEVEIIALVNNDLEKAKGKRDLYLPFASVYPSFNEMLNFEEIDFVDIITPPKSHFYYVMEAMRHNLHIICQKPLCDNFEDAKLLIESQKGYTKLFAVHENHRYRPWFSLLQEHIKNGSIGQIKLVKAIQLSPQLPTIPYKLQSSRGVLLEHGTHLIDLIHALLGKPYHVSSNLQYLSSETTGETYAHLVLEYPQSLATVDVGWKRHGALQAMFLVHGSKGEAFYEGSMVRGDFAKFQIYSGENLVHSELRNPDFEYEESFYKFEEACVQAMLSQDCTNFNKNAEQNLKTLETTFKAYSNDSLLNGKQVV